MRVAQTNLQLVDQLSCAGWHVDDIRDVGDAYEFAAVRFSGVLRASGKCFLAHLVGTASITAYAGGSAQLTMAALLHAWRLHGSRLLGYRIPRLPHPFPAAFNQELRQRIRNYETLHRRYRVLSPDVSAINRMSCGEREAMLVHLANELEEFVDGGACYAKRHKLHPDRVASLRCLAERLGHADLAALVETLTEDCRRRTVPRELLSSHDRSYTPRRRRR